MSSRKFFPFLIILSHGKKNGAVDGLAAGNGRQRRAYQFFSRNGSGRLFPSRNRQ
jgi:hypothetical protein